MTAISAGESGQKAPPPVELATAESSPLISRAQSDPEEYLALSDRLSHGQWKIFALVCVLYMMNGLANLQQVLVEREPDIECKAGQPGCNKDNACDFEWQYVEQVPATVTQTYNLVCERTWMASLLGSVFYVGFAMGSLLTGAVGDRYGRRFGLIVTLAIQSCGCLSFVASRSYSLYAFLRFVTGVGAAGQIAMGCTVLSEFMPPTWRAVTCSGWINIFWSCGGVIISSVGWVADSQGWNWQAVAGFAFVCSSMQLLWICSVPETPYFLFSQEKYARSSTTLRKIDPPKTMDQERTLDALMGGQERSVLDNRASRSLKQIVHGRSLWLILLLMMFAWFATAAAYYSLNLNTGSLPGPFYLNAILNFLVEVPALLLAIPMFDRLGRRFALGSGLVVGALCMVGMTVGDWRSIDGLLRTFAFLAKFALQVSFGTVLVYTVELFPTVLRSFGLGSCSFAATMGGVVAPVVLRGHELQGLISLTAVTLLAGVGVLTYVPETLNKPMPT